LMDVCPVGAITTREYRFKSRPWDNPGVVDTICTMCSKGCNTSAWQKAKPEWAKGSRLIRMTPRLTPEINGYWMCDIGRFDYHWVEGTTRLRRPMVRTAAGLDPLAWHDVGPKLRDAIQAAGAADPASVRFLASAHASTEELFVLKDIVTGLLGSSGMAAVTVAWKSSLKTQPAGAKFIVPSTDAPNVNGARDVGFAVGQGNGNEAAIADLRTAITSGRVKALYVLDPGPDGSLGDVSWIVSARQNSALPLLVVQGVVMSSLTAAADFVLPGAAWVEKDAIYTNDQGRVQGASRAIAPPGEAMEDWQILSTLGRLLGLSLPYRTSGDVRLAIAGALPSAYADADKVPFMRPVPARNWLQASNPSERWKWDFLYQDLPPVKGHNVQMENVAAYIPLKPVG
jgi:NADH-quinone oxidoreductase subunit G